MTWVNPVGLGQAAGGLPAYSDGGAPVLTSTGAAPAIGVMDFHRIAYRQLGSKIWQISYRFAGKISNVGSGDFLILLPNGLKFDFSSPDMDSWNGPGAPNAKAAALGPATIAKINNYQVSAFPVAYDATRFRISVTLQGAVEGYWGSGWCNTADYTYIVTQFTATML
jgi:hypothetical protein